MDDVPSEYIDKPLLLWSVDTMDWDSRNAEAVAENIRTHVYDGAVILMHDLYESTVDAMAIIIPELKALGYELVTISELSEVKGYTLEAGKAYTDFTLIESEESSNGQ
jgi:peptidoglycan/xylan/chitin deacetylase (PgdA/CDA1 family)